MSGSGEDVADDPKAPFDVILDHWWDKHPAGRDPSWPSEVRSLLGALTEAGYLIVHPARSKDDCEDPWTCCIHERPEDWR